MFLTSEKKVQSLVITASHDTTVLTEYQLKLLDLLQTKNHIHRTGNHLRVIKDSFLYNRDDIAHFFKEALGQKMI